MVIGFLDTSVVIDLLRSYPPAVQWFTPQKQVYGVLNIVWMEVIDGAMDRKSQTRAVSFLKQFEMHYLTETDMDWAMRRQLAYRLSHGIELTDCLIAAPAHRLNLPLYTQNLKHFTPLLGALAQKSY